MRQDVVTIHGSSWKLTDIQEEIDWCKAQTWRLSKYEVKDNHVHCMICWWTIAASDDPEIGIGYTKAGSHWICLECFRIFLNNKFNGL